MANGGIDLGGTKIQAAVIDGQNKVLGQARRPTPTEGGPEDVAKEMAETLREAAKAAKLEPAALKGIGVGSPGVIESGNVSTARNLPGWEGTFGLAKALKSALGVRHLGQRSATTCRSRPTPSSSWAPGGPTSR